MRKRRLHHKASLIKSADQRSFIASGTTRGEGHLVGNVFCLSFFIQFEAATNAIDTFVVPAMAHATQAFEQLTESLFWPSPGQLQQLHHWPIGFWSRSVVIDRALQSYRGASAIFCDHIFQSSVFSDRSAYICFKRRFSSSSSRSRRMSAGSIHRTSTSSVIGRIADLMFAIADMMRFG